jgi:dipeptidyl aminopeptidase/acylaminoacyl peptidase
MKTVPSWRIALYGLLAAALLSSGARATSSLADEYAKVAGVSYTTAVAAAARSDTVAWETTRAGEVALWAAVGPRYEARRLLLLSGDTGDVIGDLALSPDGSKLAYTRGPSSAPNGRTPNPAGLVGGLANALWLTDTQAGKPIKVAALASAPLFAPDSRRLVYLQAGQPQLIEITATARGIRLGAPRVLFRDFGDVEELAWSPAGDTLAFVSDRPAHSLIGTYHLGDDRVHYVAPSVYRDMGVVWSPDGRKLAFLRLPGIASADVPDVMKDSRFSIWVANLAGTEAAEIYRSPAADANLNTDGSLHWLKDGRIVFLSDADGYSHVYAVDPATRRVTQLRRGSCDEESLAVNASGDLLAASGNCDDVMRREVATWAPGAHSWNRVSSAQSVATDPVFVGTGNGLLYRSATYDRAQAPVLAASPAREMLLGSNATVTDDALQLPEVIQLKAADGTALTAIWFAPNVAHGRRAAAVVYVHGGPIRQMMPAWNMNPYYAYIYAANQVLARHGVGVLAINYRTGVGFGRAFRNAAHYGPNGASELQDVIAAGVYLRSRADIDPARIGIYGGSYGGHLTANALARRSDLFKAGVAWHGIYDFTQWITNVGHPDRLSTPWGSSEATRSLALQSSALSQVAKWRSPTLLISGDDDRNVDFAETVTLYRALQEAKVPVEVYVLPNEVHDFLRFSSWVSVIDRTGGFLLDHLAGASAAQ